MNKPLESKITSLSQRGQTVALFSNALPEVCSEGEGHGQFQILKHVRHAFTLRQSDFEAPLTLRDA